MCNVLRVDRGLLFLFLCAILIGAAIAGVALAGGANGDCCKAVSKHGGCSYECGAVDCDGDDVTDGWADLGDHSGKECVNGKAGQNCDEEDRVCGSISNITLYRLTCVIPNGVCNEVVDIIAEQCATPPDSKCGT